MAEVSRYTTFEKYITDNFKFVCKNKTNKNITYISKDLVLIVILDNTQIIDFELNQLDNNYYLCNLLKEKTKLENMMTDKLNIITILIEKYYEEIRLHQEEDAEDQENRENQEMLQEIKKLPDIKCNTERKLIIYVWGRKKRKHLPQKVDHNFNAAVLYTKKAGTDWTKDGRSEEIRNAVMKCPMFNDFLETMINTIEKLDACKIGINCRAGRHRSVTLAWILRQHYYKNAELELLEI